MAAFLPFLSGLLGWIYTFCWSASFYPQPFLNWRRKTTAGSTVDFPFINVFGFLAYFISNLAFYYSPLVRAQYAARNHGLTPAVQFNDVTFALHALILSTITTSQYLFTRSLWSFDPASGNKPSRAMLGIATGCLFGVLLTWLLVGAVPPRSGDGTRNPAVDWCDLDVVYAVGHVKLVITLIKYTPQVIANWRNKSTKGWSIWQILLDLAGGVLSIAQLGIDSYLQGDWSGVTGNPVKFALGNVSILYDAVFMVQHYVLYRHAGQGKGGRHGEDPERDRLLSEERRLD